MKPSRSGRDGSSSLCLPRPWLPVAQQVEVAVPPAAQAALGQRSLPTEACAGWAALGRLSIAGAGGSLTARPPRAGTPVGAAPLRPTPAPLSLSSLRLSRGFMPRQGCGAALPPAWGGNGAAAPAVAFSLSPELPWLCIWDFCRLLVAWLRFSCSLVGYWRGTG